jgi:hypothetical protein
MSTPPVLPTTYFGLPLQAYLQLHNLNSESFGRYIGEGDPSKPARTWTDRARRLFKGQNSPYINKRTHEPLSEKLAELYGISVFKLFPLKYHNKVEAYQAYWQTLVPRLREKGIVIPDVTIEIVAKPETTRRFRNFHTLFKAMLHEEFPGHTGGTRTGAGYIQQAAETFVCKPSRLKDFVLGRKRPDRKWFLEVVSADGMPTTRLEILHGFQCWPKYREPFERFYDRFNDNNQITAAKVGYLEAGDIRAVYRALIHIVFGNYRTAEQSLGHSTVIIDRIVSGRKPLSRYYLSDTDTFDVPRIAILVEHALRVKDPELRERARDLLKTLGDAYAELPQGLNGLKVLKHQEAVLLKDDQVKGIIAQLDQRDEQWRAAVAEVVTNIIDCYASAHNGLSAWDDEMSALAEVISNKGAQKCLESILLGESDKAQNYVSIAEAVVKAYALFHNYGREILGLPVVQDAEEPRDEFSEVLAELCRTLGALVPEVRNLVAVEAATNAI